MTSPLPPASNPLVLNYLGGFAASRADRVRIDFAYDKVRALLAYLSLEAPARHSRERLAEMFWPDAGGETGRGNLRRTLHHLRRALADEGAATAWLVGGKNDLGFDIDTPHRLDVRAFLRPLPVCAATTSCRDCLAELESRLALYRGPFLDGFSLPDAPAFDQWLEAWRERLLRHALALLQHLGECQAKLGATNRAIALAQRETELAPWAEAGHRRLMRWLSETGQNVAALAQYETCRRLLAEELGLEPEPETRELARRIRQGERAAAPPPTRPSLPPERRQVCVLACRIEPAEGRDPELLAAPLGDCHGACTETVHALGGYCVALHSGEILAYFGYPQARENAPRHTLEAALAMLGQAAAYPELRLRLSAHAGWVVDDRRYNLPDATGHLSRQALALAAQAPWGGVAVGAGMARLAEGYFRLGTGSAGSDWQLLLGASGAGHRLEAGAHRLTPLVGRRRELRLLHGLWDQARQGQRPSLLIRGEPGIGKSRLVETLIGQVDATGATWRRLRCHPEFQHTPYYPLVELLRQTLAPGEATPAGRLRQLEQWLGQADSPMRPHLPALAELLDPPMQPSLAPTARKRRTEDALLALLDALAPAQPVLLLIEDMHWADPSTRELMARHLQQGRRAGFGLYTARPEYSPPEDIRVIDLPALSPRQSAQLARLAAGRNGLGKDALAALLERSDGVPLYIEEMVRSLGEDADRAVPDTLWSLLAVRLESVGADKRLAQQAAAIGREFGADLLAALWDGDAAAMAGGLSRLEQAGLVLGGETGAYAFKHALIRDAAYQTLPLPERQAIHRRLARLLEGPFQALVGDSPERLAQHLAAAAEPLAAAKAWLQAGRLAASRSANPEAAFHFESGLAQTRLAPAGAAAEYLEFSLQAALGTTLVAMKGYGAEAAKACFARALALSRTVADDGELFQVTWGLWLGGRSCTPEAYPLEFAEKLERIALATGSPLQTMQVHYAYGNNLFWLARHDEARRHLEAAVALGATLPVQERLNLYGEDTAISSLSFLSWIDWIQGRPDTARANSERAVAAARELGHAHTLGFALTFAIVLRRHLDDPEETAVLAGELLDLAQQHQLSLWLAAAVTIGGWAAAAQGQREALAPIRQGVAAARQAMVVVEATFALFLVDALLRLGDYAECAQQATEAIALARAHQDIYLLPEFLRLRAEALYRLDPVYREEAVACLEEALALARGQRAPALELRVASSLCRHRSEKGDRQSLVEVVSRYREGMTTPDLQAALRLLATPAPEETA